MEDRFQHTVNGQSVLQADLNTLGEASSLADDRVFAELFRMQPYDGATVRKGVLPYGHAASANVGLLAANGASGSVLVNPFRAFIGSRTAVASDAKANWRNVRSAISVGATTLAQTVALGANASGNPRWDLVYAAVAVDANTASVTRKVKDPTTKVITGSSLVTRLATTVTLGVTVGTPGVSPAFPAIASDSGGTYYVPLAYVRIPNGFVASSTVVGKDIVGVAPAVTLSRATGASTLRPANQNSTIGGVAISSAGTSAVNGVLAFTGTAAQRAAAFMPPTMTGQESVLVAIDLGGASSANWTHTNLQVVDNSRDWRNRIFKWMAFIAKTGNATAAFPWNGTPNVSGCPAAAPLDAPNVANGIFQSYQLGFGQSLVVNGTYDIVLELAAGTNVPSTVMAAASVVRLLVDPATGEMKINIVGLPAASIFVWLDASAPFENAV